MPNNAPMRAPEPVRDFGVTSLFVFQGLNRLQTQIEELEEDEARQVRRQNDCQKPGLSAASELISKNIFIHYS